MGEEIKEGIKLFGARIKLNKVLLKEREEEHPTVEKIADKMIPCPRCNSIETKFCYFNNYNVNQPRHFCKSCHRYWTSGGSLRNVSEGAARRKAKSPRSCEDPGLSETFGSDDGNKHVLDSGFREDLSGKRRKKNSGCYSLALQWTTT